MKRIIISTSGDGEMAISQETVPDGQEAIILHAHAVLTPVTAAAVADVLLIAANINTGFYDANLQERNMN